MQSLNQRHHRYVAQHDFIPGTLNKMDNEASRLWHLTDAQLLNHFNSKYPQNQPWQLDQVQPAMLSSLTSALRTKPSALAFFLAPPPKRTATGSSGVTCAMNFLPTLLEHVADLCFLLSSLCRLIPPTIGSHWLARQIWHNCRRNPLDGPDDGPPRVL